MLPRIHLTISDSEISQRTEKTLADVECVMTASERKTPFWDAVKRPADLHFISVDLLPKPLADSMQSIVELPDEPAAVVLVQTENAEQRAELLAAGCYAVVSTQISDEIFRETMHALIERRQAELDHQVKIDVHRETESRLSDFASTSPTMQSFMRTVRRVVQADSSLLILGETGVGKERLARAIHEGGPRSEKPFVPVNCAAFPESLLEDELFGHQEGAFTGSTSDRRGCFEMAHGGTIFLDEIGEVPRYVQVKLLRVLQERQIQRLGSEDIVPIDVRIMAATNRDLTAEMEARRFRRDLYYRLSVVTLTVPSLRDHPEDIPALLDRYLDEFRVTLRKEAIRYSPVALQSLCDYSWPGNVRELINVVERAALLCESEEISLVDLPTQVSGATVVREEAQQAKHDASDHVELPDNWESLAWSTLRPQVVSNLERAYLRHHLQQAKGRIGETAKQANLSKRSLYLMMKRHGLKKEDFKN